MSSVLSPRAQPAPSDASMRAVPSADAQPGANAIDWMHFEVAVAGDTELEAELLALFLEQSAMLFRIIAGAAEGDEGGLEAAHRLVGAARAVGAFGVAAAASAAEAAARRGALAPGVVSRLSQAVADARVAVASRLESGARAS